MNTKRRWESLAPEYIRALQEKEKGDYLRYRLLTPNLVKVIGELRGLKVLDVGCGDGYLARHVARKGAQVWAFDWIEGLIARGLSCHNYVQCQGQAAGLPKATSGGTAFWT